jgi:hypothetical protein
MRVYQFRHLPDTGEYITIFIFPSAKAAIEWGHMRLLYKVLGFLGLAAFLLPAGFASAQTYYGYMPSYQYQTMPMYQTMYWCGSYYSYSPCMNYNNYNTGYNSGAYRQHYTINYNYNYNVNYSNGYSYPYSSPTYYYPNQYQNYYSSYMYSPMYQYPSMYQQGGYW